MQTSFTNNGTAYTATVRHSDDTRIIEVRRAGSAAVLHSDHTKHDVIFDAQNSNVDLSVQAATDTLIDDFKRLVSEGLLNG